MPARAQRDDDRAGRAAAELKEDLEGRELVALHAVGVDRVHEGDAEPLADREAGVEEARRSRPSTATSRGPKMPGGLEAGPRSPLLEEDEGLEAGPGAVGGRRRGHVAGRDRPDPLEAERDGLLDGHGGAAVLEARRRVLGLVLGVDVAEAEGRPDAAEPDERRRALAQAQGGIDPVERQELGEPLERQRPVIEDAPARRDGLAARRKGVRRSPGRKGSRGRARPRARRRGIRTCPWSCSLERDGRIISRNEPAQGQASRLARAGSSGIARGGFPGKILWPWTTSNS